MNHYAYEILAAFDGTQRWVLVGDISCVKCRKDHFGIYYEIDIAYPTNGSSDFYCYDCFDESRQKALSKVEEVKEKVEKRYAEYIEQKKRWEAEETQRRINAFHQLTIRDILKLDVNELNRLLIQNQVPTLRVDAGKNKITAVLLASSIIVHKIRIGHLRLSNGNNITTIVMALKEIKKVINSWAYKNLQHLDENASNDDNSSSNQEKLTFRRLRICQSFDKCLAESIEEELAQKES